MDSKWLPIPCKCSDHTNLFVGFFLLFSNMAAGSMASVQEHDHQNLVGIGCSHPMEVQCLTLNVYGATYASCNGYYMVTLDRVPWAPCRQVYKHVYKNRYIFWNAHGYGWSIGTKEDLITGKHYYSSHVDSKEPWQEEWRTNNNVLVKCSKGNSIKAWWYLLFY